MSDGRKRILSPFTGCKEWKAWNKTREKCMPVKRRKNLAETDRGYYKEELLEEFLDSKAAFYNRNESDNGDVSYNKNNEQQQLPEGSVSSCNKIVNGFAVCKDQKQSNGTLLLAEDVIHGFGN